jgi:hypothetical protein
MYFCWKDRQSKIAHKFAIGACGESVVFVSENERATRIAFTARVALFWGDVG